MVIIYTLKQETRSWKLLLFCAVLWSVLLALLIISARPGYKSPIARDIAANMNRTMRDYRDDPDMTFAWDTMQQKLRCCGISGASDWAVVLGAGRVPDSCCLGSAKTSCSASTGSFSVGCTMTLLKFDMEYLSSYASKAISAAVILPLMAIFGYFCGSQQIRNDDNQYQRFEEQGVAVAPGSSYRTRRFARQVVEISYS